MTSNRELKQFHSENRTHFTEEEYSGKKINVQKGTHAPFDLKICGASRQTVTVQGKNLFDMDRIYDEVVTGTQHWSAYYCDKTKVSETEWLFDNFTKGGSAPAYFVIPLEVKPNTAYVLSFTVNQYGCDGFWGIASTKTSDTTTDNADVVPFGKTWREMAADKTDVRLSFRFNSGSYEVLYWRGYFTYSANSSKYCIFKNIQLEEGSTLTDYEAFVPDSPSADYPSEIYPAENINIKCANGDIEKVTLIPCVGYALPCEKGQEDFSSDGEYFISDTLEYNSKTGVVKFISRIDETKLDFTKPLSEQSGAVREFYKESILYPAEGYDFSDTKTLQGNSVITARADGDTDVFLTARVKVLCGGASENENKITYGALNSYTYDELYEGIPKGES